MPVSSDKPVQASRDHLPPSLCNFEATRSRLSLSLSDLEYFNEQERNDIQRKDDLHKSFAGFEKEVDAAHHTPRVNSLVRLRHQHRACHRNTENRDTPPLVPRRSHDQSSRKLLKVLEKAEAVIGLSHVSSERILSDRWEDRKDRTKKELSRSSTLSTRHAPLGLSQSDHCAQTRVNQKEQPSFWKVHRRSISNEELTRVYNRYDSTIKATSCSDSDAANENMGSTSSTHRQERASPFHEKFGAHGAMDTNAFRSERTYVLNQDSAAQVPHRYFSPRKKSRGKVSRALGPESSSISFSSNTKDKTGPHGHQVGKRVSIPSDSALVAPIGKPSKKTGKSSHPATVRNNKSPPDPPGSLAEHLYPETYRQMVPNALDLYLHSDRYEGPTWAPSFQMSHSSTDSFSSVFDFDLFDTDEFNHSEIPSLTVQSRSLNFSITRKIR